MTTAASPGILAFGAYVPRRRLQRQAVVEAVGWFNPALKALGKGERAMANWDEDALTLAVAAARKCLPPAARADVDAIFAVSTSFPFADRQNSAVLAEALRLPSSSRSLDIGGSRRAATGALISALDRATGGGSTLIVASERRQARAASRQELLYGDAAAALVIGEGDALAVPVGTVCTIDDFVDQFREQGRHFDYAWEDRWIRDEGLVPILAASIKAVLERSGIAPSSISRLCLPAAASGAAARAIAKSCSIAPTALHDELTSTVGDAGCAQPLLALIDALEDARPGDLILVASFGQGSDALIFEATDALHGAAREHGVKAAVAHRTAETNYFRYLALNELVELDRGMRAEVDKATALSALHRHRDMVALVGGRCTTCRTPQFPRSRVCVNPACQAVGEQEPYGFADLIGTLQSFTADVLTYCPDPPQYYGMVQFDGGGRFMADLTDVLDSELQVGQPVEMAFRIKERDATRGFRRYFWKAVPRVAESRT